MKLIITEEQFKAINKNNAKQIISEIKIAYNGVGKLTYTPFILYKGLLTLFDSEDSNIFMQQVSNYIYDNKINADTPSTYDQASDVIEHEVVLDPRFISGYINKYNGEITMTFYKKQFLNLEMSDEIKKLTNLKNIHKYHFLSSNKVYSREELIANFGDFYNRDVKLPKFLYHGTSTDHVLSILKKGITPQKDYTNFQGINHENHIFLTSSYEIAREYSHISSSTKSLNTHNAVIKIDTSKIDKNKITFDYDFYHKYVGKGNEEFDEMGKGIRFGGKGSELQDKWNQNPGAKYAKLGYKGTVYPSAIVSIMVIKGFYDQHAELTPNEFITAISNNTL